ncbi:MAG TPA: hypothetical protein VFG42_19700 [Baekduia sp.]|uniref:hypothetical protein n=1 Tax=Baekduia sp. TaxID=2600305 RepID=UPI002D76D2CC|nr:hypothetical protein [Baekduia sp.]HET6509028.1 hypothetical protein [Baekduia sp.]
MTPQPFMQHSPYIPVDPSVGAYVTTFGHLSPLTYTGWKDEVMSFKESCYIHGGLNPPAPFRVTGPEATKMLNEVCVNNVENLKVGKSTHAILCAPTGNIIEHGMLLRLGEQEYLSYFLSPPLAYYGSTGRWNATVEDLTGQVFVFQVAGPRSLEVLETAFGQELRDIPYLGHRQGLRLVDQTVETGELQVLRIGMAGVLSYEVGGNIADAIAVYDALEAAGQEFGIRRFSLGTWFPFQHTENGFAQSIGHFQLAFDDDPGLSAWLSETLPPSWPTHPNLHGSMGPDLRKRYINPVDVGWDYLVKLDHDFVGREALEPLKANPTKKMVTLEWNVEDILDTYRSHFEPGEEHQLIGFPTDSPFENPGWSAYNDQVLKDGVYVGMSMGRVYSYYYRKMISICPIDVACGEPGTEVSVLWGEPGTRQKEIRATVSAFPILDLPRNEQIDVSTLPRVVSAGGAA